jgi:hypothetical protein
MYVNGVSSHFVTLNESDRIIFLWCTHYVPLLAFCLIDSETCELEPCDVMDTTPSPTLRAAYLNVDKSEIQIPAGFPKCVLI